MAIVLSCECGRKLQVKEEFAGQEGECPSCGRTMLIPDPGDPVNAPLRTTNAVEEYAAPSSIPDAIDRNGEPIADAGKLLLNHGGGPIPPDSDFFAEPPPEIGPVISAHTTLSTKQRPWTLSARLILAGCVGLLGLGAGALVVIWARPREEFWHFLWPTVGSVAGSTICWALTRFAHRCSYVGRDGIARSACSGSRERIGGADVFLFSRAIELRSVQSKQYHKGVYIGTKYRFTWSDAAGRNVYDISGTYISAAGTPPSKDPFHYGLAAELAWTCYLAARAESQLASAGSFTFRASGGQELRVTRESLVIQQRGNPTEWAAAEIEAVVVDDSSIKIKHRGAKEGWFSSTGVAKFPLAEFPNVRFFLSLMADFLGVAVR